MYSGEGLCRIEKIGVPDFRDDKKEYYCLQNPTDSIKVYVPTDTKQPMRRPMTATEAERFLEDLRGIRVDIQWRRDIKQRQRVIADTLRDQTPEAMAKTIIMIRKLHPGGDMPAGEKLILTRTEKNLCDELAFALDIPVKESEARVMGIMKELTKKEKKEEERP